MGRRGERKTKREIKNALALLGALFGVSFATPFLAGFFGMSGYLFGMFAFAILLVYIALREHRISAVRYGRLRDAPRTDSGKTPALVNAIIIAFLVAMFVAPLLIMYFVYGLR